MTKTRNRINYPGSDNNDGNNTSRNARDGVGSREREDEVLSILAELGIPLPPVAIFRALKIKRKITFEYRTVQDILRRLLDQGYVMRCDKDALDEGEIKELPKDSEGRRTYYYLTESGFDRIED